MNTFPGYTFSLYRRVAAFLSIVALLSGTFAVSASAQQPVKSQRLSEDQRILHVLNRLGFGARPGDLERVRAMGLDNYIKQQLYPDQLADAAVEAKLKALPTLSMSIPELYAKYPQPGMLLRVLERRGELPPELAAARDARTKDGNQPTAATPPGAANSMKTADDAAKDSDAAKANNNEYRKAIRDYYLKNNLQPPQRIVAELQSSRILRAVYSERQLQEVMVDFWENHFNIYAAKGADRWLLVSYDRDTIRPNAFGKFRDLLVATAQSPAMLFYLDNFQSVSPNAQMPGRGNGLRQILRGGGGRNPNAPQQGQMPSQQRPQQQPRAKRGINENYARELMELHTLGVDGGYTQKDVQEVARCFTGWTIQNPRGGGGDYADAGKFVFNPRLHDDGEKIVLGQRIPAGGGIKDGLMVLDILARQPATAKFIATKLARRFVMDEPTPALVNRISAAFTKSDGDIRETLRAIFASPEFNSPEAYRAKIKTPFELAVSAIRTLGGETNGGPGIHQWIAKMGEPLYQYQAPTGYPDTAADWVNTGSLLERLNFGLALASNRIPGTSVNLSRFSADSTKGMTADKSRIMERFLNVIVQGDVSPNTRAILLKQLNEPISEPAALPPAETTGMMEARQAQGRRAARQTARMDTGAIAGDPETVKIVGLILGSPEFQRQ